MAITSLESEIAMLVAHQQGVKQDILDLKGPNPLERFRMKSRVQIQSKSKQQNWLSLLTHFKFVKNSKGKDESQKLFLIEVNVKLI